MVGAKEFAIRRKIIEKKTKNPLIEGISIPKFMKSHESDMKEIAGSFLDKQPKNSFNLPKIAERKENMVRRFPQAAQPYNTRTANPLIKGIAMPKVMSGHEKSIDGLIHSFLDKQNKNSFNLPKMIEHKEIMVKRFPKMDKPYDARSINPILEDSKSKKTIASKKPRQMDNNMFNISPLFDFMKSNMGGENKHEEHEECNDLSDELANHITYKVFQNIKNYLDRDLDKPMGNRQIKLEISL